MSLIPNPYLMAGHSKWAHHFALTEKGLSASTFSAGYEGRDAHEKYRKLRIIWLI
jgi:hypothetical protein